MNSTRRNPSVRLVCALAAIVAFGSCSSGEGTDDATSTTSTTTATTTTATTTTTTTTLPPGLAAQELGYDLSGGRILTHGAEHEITIEMRPGGSDGFDLFGPDDTTTAMVIEGNHRTLFIEIPGEGESEIVQDFTAREGSVTFTVESSEFKQTFSRDELENFDDVALMPVVIHASGSLGDGLGGAPGYHRATGRQGDLLGLLGPLFGDQEVDEGDSWSVEIADAVLGPLSYSAEITEEKELEDGVYVFVVDYTSELADPPVEVDFNEGLAAIGGADANVFSDLGLDTDLFEGALVFTDATVTGTAWFDPLAGVVTRLDVTTVVDVELTLAFEEESASGGMTMTTVSALELTGVDDSVASFERAAVLDRFEADPYLLAEESLAPVFWLDWEMPDAETVDAIFEHLDLVGGVAAGYTYLRLVAPDDTAVDVVVMTNGGNLRGNPGLAELIAEVLTGRSPNRVTVAGTDAYRITLDGTEWLLWNSDTHTYIVIGKRAMATLVMTDFINGPAPYLWQTGDCLDFGDFYDETPHSPFGRYGLEHCSHPHTYEVLHSEILEDGPDSDYPDDLGEHVAQRCGARFYEHTGTFPLESSLSMVQYLPDPDEWDRGARYIACVIYLQDEDGRVRVESRLEGAGKEHPIDLEPGVCLLAGIPVPCADPHGYEVMSVHTYEAGADAEYPDLEEAFDAMEDVCEADFEQFGATEGDELEVTSGVITDLPHGWSAGVRTYYCVAYAVDADDWLVEITGELTGEWEEAPLQTSA
jgi:hypothetical protein